MKRPRLYRASTRAFAREARRTPDYSFFDWVHGYVYTRWPYLYIGIGTREHPLGRLLGLLTRALARVNVFRSNGDSDRPTFADGYHGKVVPLEAARKMVTIQEEISLTNLEQIIPYSRARDIILRNPDHIVVLDCPCRASRANPCRPLDVCLIVGEPFASMIADHHPSRSRWITQQEAEEILEAEQKRGHVHHAFFKDAMLGRFYAICNCCSCCCGAMHAWRNGTPMLVCSGYVSQAESKLCAGCGLCVENCPFGALSLDGHGLVMVDAERCMGCGVCVSMCAEGALLLVRDPARGEPLEISELVGGTAEI